MADDTLRPAAADETKDPAAQGASTADASGEETPPKRRTRHTTIDLTSSATSSASTSRSRKKPEEPAPAADEAPKRRSRKKADASSADATPDATPDAPAPKRRTRPKAEPSPEASAETPSEDAAPRRRRTRAAEEPVASSDNLPDEPAAGDAEPEPAESRAPRNGHDDRDDRDDDGARRRKRKRNKKGGGPNPNASPTQGTGQTNGGGGGHPGEPFDGMLELIGDKKFGFIRGFKASLQKGDNDPFMPPPLIQKYNLRDGVHLSGLIKPGRKGAWQVTEVHEVMGVRPEEWAETPDFDEGLVIYPEEKLQLVTGPSDVSMRVVDIVAPLGKGQRALIVAPPRAGKTILLKQIAAGLTQNHPNVKLVALLIDERPEEVTDFRRNTDATVFASSNDYGEDNHVRVATLAFEYSRRLVEQGHDVVILLDSLTRLGRTFNLFGGNSGRTMSGGLDARALLVPRKIFGSARNIEDGGSLTIVATALIETGSRMDDVIFEEFKGTGNSEIVLDRELSEKRMYPAINIRKSGTRNEDRLVAEEHLRQRHMLLRALNSRHPVEAMQALVKQIQLSPSNVHLLNELIPE